MTPNPNPSPELREAAREFMFNNWPSWDTEFAGAQTALEEMLAALSPQTLPAPGEVERAYVAGFEQGWEYPRDTSPTQAAEEYARGYVAIPATVAAANDEGVARLKEALEWALSEIGGSTRYTDPQQRQNCINIATDALAASVKDGGL